MPIIVSKGKNGGERSNSSGRLLMWLCDVQGKKTAIGLLNQALPPQRNVGVKTKSRRINYYGNENSKQFGGNECPA